MGGGREGGERGKQQPVLGDHGTHYSTDAAADLVGERREPFPFSPATASAGSSSVLTPLLPAISPATVRAGCEN
jgi:hypothetical protein